MAVGLNPIPNRVKICLKCHGSTVPFALLNLDNGLFLEKAGMWTIERTLVQTFEDTDDVSKAAKQHKVANAAAVMVKGNPPEVRAFFWMQNPN